MSRFARQRRVFFVEEPVFESGNVQALEVRTCPRTGVHVLVPHISESCRSAQDTITSKLLRSHFARHKVHDPIAWFYTPMALDYFPESISPSLTIYDCMDELSLFRNAPPRLQNNERRLLRMAQLVFTGGVSLFEHKRAHHSSIYPFPSGVDVHHFAGARAIHTDQYEQIGMPRPRLGFAGVIDERLDLELLRGIAQLRPHWQLVMIGPVVKIDPESLPRSSNIHWLGMKDYRELPAYFAGWDVAMLPFALNDATRFISPTKTPEYLSAGLPVVSTPIRDVVRPYGELGLARIARNAEEFVAAAEHLIQCGMTLKWRERADAFLRSLSWDSVWSEMNSLIQAQLDASQPGNQTTQKYAATQIAHV